jgi:hypothetical protein
MSRIYASTEAPQWEAPPPAPPARPALRVLRDWLRDRPERASLLRVLACLVLTRAALLLAAHLAVRVGNVHIRPDARREFRDFPAIGSWLRLDAEWLLSIVTRGYSFEPGRASNVAFLPGFPVAVKLASLFLPSPTVAGLFVANVSFAAAVWVLWSWVRERAGLAAAERAAFLLMLYPLSYYFNTAYSEGLFFLLCVLSLRAADRAQWVAAGLWATLATLTRPMGILLVPAFALALARPLRFGQISRRAALAMVLPVLGLASFAVYLWIEFGTPFAVMHAHRAGWNVGQGLNLPQLRRHAFIELQILDVFQVFLPFVIAALTVIAWKRFGAVAGAYAALAAIVGTVLGGDSLGREALAVVPAFAALGIVDFRPVATAGIRFAAFALLLTFAHAFVVGRSSG